MISKAIRAMIALISHGGIIASCSKVPLTASGTAATGTGIVGTWLRRRAGSGPSASCGAGSSDGRARSVTRIWNWWVFGGPFQKRSCGITSNLVKCAVPGSTTNDCAAKA